ncbi:MAG: hypothetical protein ACR2K3_07490 [Nocardioides sp.]
MSKERAHRRAERERLAALGAEKRAREDDVRRRREARRRSLVDWVPRPPRLRPGIVAARRRREVALTVAILVALNLVVWLADPRWSTRIGALVVTLLVAPVVHVMVVRR